MMPEAAATGRRSRPMSRSLSLAVPDGVLELLDRHGLVGALAFGAGRLGLDRLQHGVAQAFAQGRLVGASLPEAGEGEQQAVPQAHPGRGSTLRVVGIATAGHRERLRAALLRSEGRVPRAPPRHAAGRAGSRVRDACCRRTRLAHRRWAERRGP